MLLRKKPKIGLEIKITHEVSRDLCNKSLFTKTYATNTLIWQREAVGVEGDVAFSDTRSVYHLFDVLSVQLLVPNQQYS